MANLVSHENIIAPLLTLKLAEIPIENIELIGEIEHFSFLVKIFYEKIVGHGTGATPPVEADTKQKWQGRREPSLPLWLIVN